MPDTPSSEMPNPAVLRFRGLDLEAMTAQQMRNIDGLRRMTNLMFDSARTITERQATFLEASAERMGAAFESEDGLSDPKAILEQQTEAYRDLFGALAAHAGELADITSKCCAGLAEEATGSMIDLPADESPAEPPAESAGCCCGPSKETTGNKVDRPTAKSRTKRPAKEGLADSKASPPRN